MLFLNAISLRSAWRNILHQRIYSVMHIGGLAIGICACVAIFLIAQYEFSFDAFHPGASRIYRVVAEVRTDEGNTVFWNSPFPQVSSIEPLVMGFTILLIYWLALYWMYRNKIFLRI